MRAAGLRYACTRVHAAAWAVGGKPRRRSQRVSSTSDNAQRKMPGKGASCPHPGMYDWPYNAHQGASSTRLIARAQSQVSRRVAFSRFCCLPSSSRPSLRVERSGDGCAGPFFSCSMSLCVPGLMAAWTELYVRSARAWILGARGYPVAVSVHAVFGVRALQYHAKGGAYLKRVLEPR